MLDDEMLPVRERPFVRGDVFAIGDYLAHCELAIFASWDIAPVRSPES